MSVLIKGMEMPKTCNDCLICCEHSMLYKAVTDRRSPKCPLISIPPHGRLIDADVFIRNIRLTIRYDPFAVAGVISFVQDAPTIIPAEGGE